MGGSHERERERGRLERQQQQFINGTSRHLGRFLASVSFHVALSSEARVYMCVLCVCATHIWLCVLVHGVSRDTIAFEIARDPRLISTLNNIQMFAVHGKPIVRAEDAAQMLLLPLLLLSCCINNRLDVMEMQILSRHTYILQTGR